ncbi:MAG TPA: hypothetical protein VFU43_22495 [Streptosporangiaceae bacterium]|nr:hypothetical protein [Streptosporangiaceae bacterium]
MTRFTASVLAAATCVGLAACTAGAATFAPPSTAHAAFDTPTARGRVVSGVHLDTLSAKRVRTWLASDGFDTAGGAVRRGHVPARLPDG